MSAEDTDLERRVLAHEQILQALIAHMVETEPRFLERLSTTFDNPVRLGPAKYDYVDTATYAARFVSEIVRMGELPTPPETSALARWDGLWPTVGEDNLQNANIPVCFRIRRREDLWEVLRNGRLVGGYVSCAGALAAAHEAIHEVFSAGGSAELVAGQKPEKS